MSKLAVGLWEKGHPGNGYHMLPVLLTILKFLGFPRHLTENVCGWPDIHDPW